MKGFTIRRANVCSKHTPIVRGNIHQSSLYLLVTGNSVIDIPLIMCYRKVKCRYIPGNKVLAIKWRSFTECIILKDSRVNITVSNQCLVYVSQRGGYIMYLLIIE